MPRKVEEMSQATRYVAKNGQTLLFGAHKIAGWQDNQAEHNDLLILITASTTGSSEQDKLAKTENLIVNKPAIIQTKTERPNDSELKKTKAEQTVTEIFEIRYADPNEIVKSLRTLISTQPGNGSIIEQDKHPIVLIPQPTYNWIIAKASAEEIKQIGQWIKKLDIKKSTMGLDPLDKAVHEQLEMIVDLSDLAPQMSFSEVVEILENSVEPPLQIQPIWKDLLDNAEVEQATPAGMDPLPHIKLSKALEILLASVSSTELPKLTYIVDDGVILIGTVDMLPPKLDGIRSHREKEIIQSSLGNILNSRKELQEANLPLAPKVSLINNTFIDETIRNTLEFIAAAANVNIITDDTIEGIVSCTLKDVTVETALDIVLGGTPYVWKKTPDYYLVVSAVEPSEKIRRVESARKLSSLGKALLIYANDHDDKYPNSLFTFSKHMKWQDFNWIRQNAEYLASGKTLANRPDTIIAYDKTLLSKGKGTNVLYNDCHVGFVKGEGLKKLGISESAIMIETIFLSVSEDYLKYVGLDANTANFSDGWTRLLAAESPAGPNGQPYGLIIDDLHVTFLLRAVKAHHDSKALVAPRVLTRAGTMAEIRTTTEEYHYISGYNEPNNPSDEPEPKLDMVDLGTHLWLTPKLTDDSRNINLDLKLELRQLEGIIEGKYKEKYPYFKPIVDVISAKMPCTIPDGKTMLIGGLKIIEPIIKEPGTPGLKDLPLIGAAFGSKDKTKVQKMLLILVKPVTNPQQKATKILPGQEDSEEHIKGLAEQLEKKINPPGKPE